MKIFHRGAADKNKQRCQCRSQNIELGIIGSDSRGMNIEIYMPLSFDFHQKLTDNMPHYSTLRHGGCGDNCESHFIYSFRTLEEFNGLLYYFKAATHIDIGEYDKDQIDLYLRRHLLHCAIDAGLGDDLKLTKE